LVFANQLALMLVCGHRRLGTPLGEWSASDTLRLPYAHGRAQRRDR
jgi:hypothetical protein